MNIPNASFSKCATLFSGTGIIFSLRLSTLNLSFLPSAAVSSFSQAERSAVRAEIVPDEELPAPGTGEVRVVELRIAVGSRAEDPDAAAFQLADRVLNF